MQTIRETLRDSGRLEAIEQILCNITKKTNSSIPVRIQFDSDYKPISRVDGEDVIKGIEVWHKCIETTGESISDKEAEDMFALSAVVDSELEMRLHNYANSCAHRHIPDEAVLEEIRAYSVLGSSLDTMTARLRDDFTNEFIPFSVPTGWKVA